MLRKRRLRLIFKVVIAFFVLILLVYLFSRKIPHPQTIVKSLEFNPCEEIKSIATNEYNVTISFKKNLPDSINQNIINYLGYQTSAFGLPLYVLPRKTKIVRFHPSLVTIEFQLPVIQNYTGYLFCVNPKTWKPPTLSVPSSVLKEVDTFVPMNMSITNFTSSFNWSQVKCYGDSFETRFCEMRRISMHRNLIVFSSPVHYSFPEPFLSAGARSAPFDRYESRLIYEPIVINHPLASITKDIMHIPDLSYIIARFYNSWMLWHTTFDFLVPAFGTFDIIEGKNKYRDRLIFLRDNDFKAFPEIISSLSTKEIVYLLNDNITRVFDRVVLGLKKYEENPSASRDSSEMLNIRYNFQNDTCPSLRDEVLRKLDIHSPELSVDTPKILMIERKTGNRMIMNIEEIEGYIRQECEFCEIKRVDMGSIPVIDQIKLIAESTVLIGVHGSGLSHCLWMQRSTKEHPTSMIEIKPHGYTCRDWFHSASIVAGIDYYDVYSGKKNYKNNLTELQINQLENCWSHPEWCPTQICHDLLRDQNITLEISTFSSVWKTITTQLRNNIKS